MNATYYLNKFRRLRNALDATISQLEREVSPKATVQRRRNLIQHFEENNIDGAWSKPDEFKKDKR